MDPPPLLLSIDHWNTTTLHHFNLVLRNMEFHIKKYGDSTVQTHYHFTVSHMDIAPLSLSLSLSLSSCCYYGIAPLSNEPYISGTPLHQISFTYRRMHIYP